MRKRVEINVFGNVQGVFFRQGVKNKADELGVSGFVKNLEDGSVKIIAEGEEDKLEKLIDWCKNSPGFAEVKEVKIDWLEAENKFNDFRIIF